MTSSVTINLKSTIEFVEFKWSPYKQCFLRNSAVLAVHYYKSQLKVPW